MQHSWMYCLHIPLSDHSIYKAIHLVAGGATSLVTQSAYARTLRSRSLPKVLSSTHIVYVSAIRSPS